MGEYFQSYARHFGLEEHIRFNTSVHVVTRHDTQDKWNVSISGPDGGQVLVFDKLVFAHGPHTMPNLPPMPGRELFKGSIIHGQKYRRYAPGFTHNPYEDQAPLLIIVTTDPTSMWTRESSL